DRRRLLVHAPQQRDRADRRRANQGRGGRVMSYAYETDGAAIYKRSFAIIRAEAKLDRFVAGDEKVAVRIIHASGMVDVADDIVFSNNFPPPLLPRCARARRSSA